MEKTAAECNLKLNKKKCAILAMKNTDIPHRDLGIREVDKRKSVGSRFKKTFEGHPFKNHFKYLGVRINGRGVVE